MPPPGPRHAVAVDGAVAEENAVAEYQMAMIVNAAPVGAPSIGNFQVGDCEQNIVADTDQAHGVVVRVAGERHVVAAGVEERIIRDRDGVGQRKDAVGCESDCASAGQSGKQVGGVSIVGYGTLAAAWQLAKQARCAQADSGSQKPPG